MTSRFAGSGSAEPHACRLAHRRCDARDGAQPHGSRNARWQAGGGAEGDRDGAFGVVHDNMDQLEKMLFGSVFAFAFSPTAESEH